jgi:hypothetical protein
MPKKNGLGASVNKSIEMMDAAEDVLKDLAKMPLKKGLRSNHISDEDIEKMIDQVTEEATALAHKIENLGHRVNNAKPEKVNSRFASQVVQRFLESQS